MSDGCSDVTLVDRDLWFVSGAASVVFGHFELLCIGSLTDGSFVTGVDMYAPYVGMWSDGDWSAIMGGCASVVRVSGDDSF